MKLNNIKYFSLAAVFAMACEEPEAPTPVPATAASTLSANFSFINAVPDAPASLDFYVNNVKIGSSAALSAGVPHTAVNITTNGVGANTNIRVKPSSGSIGGVLGSSDLIYRAGNNNANNFVASASARYTLIALDSVTRPRPVRLLNAGGFGDTTFYNKATGQYVSVVQKAAMTSTQKAQLVGIGTVPLGSSDPGGPRFLLLTDTYPTQVATTTTDAAIRFLNVSPNAPALHARLKFVSGTGANIGIGSAVANLMAWPTFNPSVGSRSTTSAFTMRTTAPGGTPNVYDVEIATDAGFTNIIATTSNVSFAQGKVYTIVAAGLFGKTDARKLAAGIVLHN